MLAPFTLAFAAFSLWPLARTIGLSVDAGDPLRHYAFVANDPIVWLAAANTVGFAVAFAVGQTILAAVAALVIDATPRAVARPLAALCFATHLLGSTFAAILFATALGGRSGLVNATLLTLGLVDTPIGWLTTPALAMPVLVAVAVYAGFGFGTIYLLAALRRVDRDLLDAARIDGAGPLRRVASVTIPQLRPTLSLLTIAAVFWGLGAFELPYVLFDGPGPGYRALTGAMLIFSSAFERGEVGYASALSVLLATLTAIVTLGLALSLRVGREEVTVG